MAPCGPPWIRHCRIAPSVHRSLLSGWSLARKNQNLYIVSPLDICRRGQIKLMMMMMMMTMTTLTTMSMTMMIIMIMRLLKISYLNLNGCRLRCSFERGFGNYIDPCPSCNFRFFGICSWHPDSSKPNFAFFLFHTDKVVDLGSTKWSSLANLCPIEGSAAVLYQNVGWNATHPPVHEPGP